MEYSSGPSYWTLRRKSKEMVDRHLESINLERSTLSQQIVEDSAATTYSLESLATQSVGEEGSDGDNSSLVEDSEISATTDPQVDCYEGPSIDDSDQYMDCVELPDELSIDDFVDAYETFPQHSDDSGTSDGDDFEPLQSSLITWAAEHSVTLAALSDLLKLLAVHHPSLPKDARTLLGTVRSVAVVEKAGGQYHNFGVLNAIKRILGVNKDQLEQNMVVNLQVNIDGLPLFKSSRTQLWPILGHVMNFNCEPVLLGLYCGSAKPTSLDEYFEDFVNEVVDLETGFAFEGLTLTLKLSSAVCDAPACAFVKNIKGHTGYFGCGKCKQEGVYTDHRVVFPDTGAPLRTDEDFSQFTNEEHHLGTTPLQRTSLGMVSGFPLDYMHLICLGVMRRLLMLWLKGPLNCRLSSHNITRLSQRITEVCSYVPLEFARRPRALRDLERWKATEFRQFLLYTGPIILKDILNTAIYHNFLLLSVGISILSHPRLKEDYLEYANAILISFVQHFGELYGKKFISYNVHNVVHLAEDVRKHGLLDDFSAFKFENFLQKLKKLVRKPQHPVSQIVRRLSETPEMAPRAKTHTITLKKQHCSGPLPQSFDGSGVTQYHQVQTGRFALKMDRANCFVSIQGSTAKVLNILSCRGEAYVVFKKLANHGSFFQYPLSSDLLGISVVGHASDNTEMCKLEAIEHKVFLVPFEDRFVSVPLLHTNERPHL